MDYRQVHWFAALAGPRPFLFGLLVVLYTRIASTRNVSPSFLPSQYRRLRRRTGVRRVKIRRCFIGFQSFRISRECVRWNLIKYVKHTSSSYPDTLWDTSKRERHRIATQDKSFAHVGTIFWYRNLDLPLICSHLPSVSCSSRYFQLNRTSEWQCSLSLSHPYSVFPFLLVCTHT